MDLIPVAGEEKFWCPNMLSSVSFAGITFNKCAVLLTASDWDVNWRPPVQGELPPVQVKEPYSTVSLHDYLILQNQCVQCVPAHYPRRWVNRM